MKIFMILLITLLTISTVSAFPDTARIGFNCKTNQNCGFSARCIQGYCMSLPETLTGGFEGPPDADDCDGRCEKPYECLDGKCLSVEFK